MVEYLKSTIEFHKQCHLLQDLHHTSLYFLFHEISKLPKSRSLRLHKTFHLISFLTQQLVNVM